MRWKRTFPPEPQSVTASRRFTTEVLAGIPPEALQTLELLVSELSTNAVRHVETGFDLVIRKTSGEVRVEVTDHGGGTPSLRSPGPGDPSGRGLRIVEMLSDAWGVKDRTRTGKTVWFTISLAAASAR